MKFIPLLVIALLIISCGKTRNEKKKVEGTELAPPDTAGAVRGDWVVIGRRTYADRLNPWISQDAGSMLLDLIYENLNENDPFSWDLRPSLASLPEISEDHLEYTYILNPKARFSDGTPVTGDDIIFSLKAVKNPFVEAVPLKNLLESIKKAELVNGNSNAIKVYLSRPNFRTGHNLNNLAIMPKHVLDPDNLTDKITWDEMSDMKAAEKKPAIKKLAGFINSPDVSREPQYLTGTGPYKFEKWEANGLITLVRNENFWRKSEKPQYPDRIIFKTINDNSATLIASKNKEIDCAQITPFDYFNELEDAGKFSLIMGNFPYPGYDYIGWNEQVSLFKDKKVRMALACFFNKKEILDKLLYGMAEPIQSHIFYKDKKYLNTELPVNLYDPGKAKNLLKEAGWEDADGDKILDKIIDGKKIDFKFTFLCENLEIPKKVLLVYSDELRKAGIEANVQPLETSVLWEKVAHHEFEAEYARWTIGLIPFPFAYFHSLQVQAGGNNDIYFINRESDSLIEAYNVEFDEGKRIDILKKWQKLFFDEQPLLFLWTQKRMFIYDNRFRNVRIYNYGYRYNEWWVPREMQKYR